jgi:hypothetical protein
MYRVSAWGQPWTMILLPINMCAPHLYCWLRLDLANILLILASNRDTPDLCLPSTWDYRHVLSHPAPQFLYNAQKNISSPGTCIACQPLPKSPSPHSQPCIFLGYSELLALECFIPYAWSTPTTFILQNSVCSSKQS